MTKYREIPWPRIAAEGAVIVVSILMAFAIDTWWQDRTKAEEAHALLVSLRVDFQASQSHVEVWLAGNKRILRASTDFLDQLRNTGIDEELLVPIDWLVATIVAPTYSPTDSTLRTAISSGQIELIAEHAESAENSPFFSAILAPSGVNCCRPLITERHCGSRT